MYDEQDFEQRYRKNSTLPQSLQLDRNAVTEQSDEEKVVKEIGKLIAAAKRRAIVIGLVTITVSAALMYQMRNKAPNYQGAFQLLVEPVNTAESRLQALITETEGNKFATYNGKDFGLDYDTQIKVLKSQKVMTPIVKKIREKYPDFAPSEVVVERPFEGSTGTRILRVSTKHLDPRRVKFILEVVAEAYLEYSRDSRQSNLKEGIKFIEEQIPGLRKRVADSQAKIQKIRQRYSLMDPDYEAKKLIEHSGGLENRILETKANLAQARLERDAVRKLLDRGNFAAVLSKNAVAYGALIRDSHSVNNQIVAESARLEEEHPTLKILREKQQYLTEISRQEAASILKKLDAEVQGLAARQSILMAGEQALNARAEILPEVASEYATLQGDLQVAKETLKQYLSKLDGLQIDAAQQTFPWEMIAPPGKPKALGGVTRKSQILTVIVGFVMGVGAAFLLEILNNVFHTPEDLEDDTNLPILAMIPFSKELRKELSLAEISGKKVEPMVGAMVPRKKPAIPNVTLGIGTEFEQYSSSPVVEAFRSLYTNIRLLSSEISFQSLVISAATPKEGKSTVTINLAKTAAAIGQRVLLVDADMRQPKIHKKLNIPNLRGLSDAISTDISLNDAIQRAPLDDNLFVLTAGPVREDPIKLLSDKKMRSLMEQFQDFFDLVIYDTPPLMGLADASILAAQTDGLILVVKIDKTDRSLVTKALDRLKISGASVLGVVANGIKD